MCVWPLACSLYVCSRRCTYSPRATRSNVHQRKARYSSSGVAGELFATTRARFARPAAVRTGSCSHGLGCRDAGLCSAQWPIPMVRRLSTSAGVRRLPTLLRIVYKCLRRCVPVKDEASANEQPYPPFTKYNTCLSYKQDQYSAQIQPDLLETIKFGAKRLSSKGIHYRKTHQQGSSDSWCSGVFAGFAASNRTGPWLPE